MDRETYLQHVREHLSGNARLRTDLCDELRDHLIERWEELRRVGLSEAETLRQVLNEFGEPKAAAEEISYPAQSHRRRTLMKAITGTLGVAATFVAASLWLGQTPTAQRAEGQPTASAAPSLLAHPLIGTSLYDALPAAANLPGLLATSNLGNVPAQVNHQGVITVNGQRFNGQGLFRFAIVDASGAAVRWTNSADSSPADGVPDSPVTLNVVDGIYNVRLGDSSLINMGALSPSQFEETGLKLRVWFDDNQGHGNQLLSPEQPLTSSPYAFMAATVADSSITTDKLADGAVTTTKLSGTFDGWIPAEETWTFASATAFTVAGDMTAKYTKGTRLRYQQGSGYKYAVVVNATYAAGFTTVVGIAGTDYSFTNAAISNNGFSYDACPQGYPTWFNYPGTVRGTGGSAGSFAEVVQNSRFRITGRSCYVSLYRYITNKGSWTGYVQMDLPVAPIYETSWILAGSAQRGCTGYNTRINYPYVISVVGSVVGFTSQVGCDSLGWGEIEPNYFLMAFGEYGF